MGGFFVGDARAHGEVCVDRDALVTHLKKNWKETVVGQGVMPDGALAQLLRSDDGQTWTVIAIKPNGAACVLLIGSDWETISQRTNGARFVPPAGRSALWRVDPAQAVGP